MKQKKKINEEIVELAADIFKKFGFKKTTIDDIALAAHKGKSSLYYYFKSKEDIFKAVVDKEAAILEKELTGIIESPDITPQEKLKRYVLHRMKRLQELSNYYDALKNDYLSHYGFIEEIRSKHDKTEINLIMRILDEGNSKGIFDIKDTYTAAFAISIAMKGLEIPMFLKNQIEHTEEKINFLLQILFKGIEKR
jgi:AcrR family transcriptional regulator